MGDNIAPLDYMNNHNIIYSQTCVQRPPLGPEKYGHYAEGRMKKISGK